MLSVTLNANSPSIGLVDLRKGETDCVTKTYKQENDFYVLVAGHGESLLCSHITVSQHRH